MAKDIDFNPQGPRGPRRFLYFSYRCLFSISIHKALAGLDHHCKYPVPAGLSISIHKALAGLDQIQLRYPRLRLDFNPQGPRGPRLPAELLISIPFPISIHKALAGLDAGSV